MNHSLLLQPSDSLSTMSRGGSLRVKSLFKLKASDKDKEHKQSGYFPDGAGEPFSIPPQSPEALSPGATLAPASLPLSPRAKKGLRLLFRSSAKKAKRKASEGEAESFSHEYDEMGSFSRRR